MRESTATAHHWQIMPKNAIKLSMPIRTLRMIIRVPPGSAPSNIALILYAHGSLMASAERRHLVRDAEMVS